VKVALNRLIYLSYRISHRFYT